MKDEIKKVWGENVREVKFMRQVKFMSIYEAGHRLEAMS